MTEFQELISRAPAISVINLLTAQILLHRTKIIEPAMILAAEPTLGIDTAELIDTIVSHANTAVTTRKTLTRSRTGGILTVDVSSATPGGPPRPTRPPRTAEPCDHCGGPHLPYFVDKHGNKRRHQDCTGKDENFAARYERCMGRRSRRRLCGSGPTSCSL